MSQKKKSASDTELPLVGVSARSTKDQIFTAYQEALKELEETRMETPQDVKKRTDEDALLTRVAPLKSPDLLGELASLKGTLTEQMDDLSQSLSSEFQKLTDLRQAITLETAHLQELYGIKDAAHALSALVLAQQEQRRHTEASHALRVQTFEQDMKEKEEGWRRKLQDLEEGYKERVEALAKNRKRDEEEYLYTLDVARRKERDDYEKRKSLLEKELEAQSQAIQSREARVAEKEQEFEALRQRVDRFTSDQEAAIEAAVKAATTKLTEQHRATTALREMEIQGETKIHLLRIASLEDKIKESEAFVAQLNQKADQAVAQVQTIACQALDTAGRRGFYGAVLEGEAKKAAVS